MRWTMKHYEILKEAIASGVTEVSYGDRRVKYRSLAEMKEVLADMEEELGIKKHVGRVYMSTSTGVRG